MASFDSKRMFKDTEEQTINSDFPEQVVKTEEKRRNTAAKTKKTKRT